MKPWYIALGLLVAGTPRLGGQEQRSQAGGPAWRAEGTLLEACSCNVPCPCNFGQGPTHDTCNSVYAYRLKTARVGTVKLDGLVFGGVEGPHGPMGFLDIRATPEQRPALEKLARAVFAKGGPSNGPRTFAIVDILAKDDPRSFQVRFGPSGGFAANTLIGRDGKTPIIVENNTIWPVVRFAKGKTSSFDYKDVKGNLLQYKGVNANKGDFDLAE